MQAHINFGLGLKIGKIEWKYDPSIPWLENIVVPIMPLDFGFSLGLVAGIKMHFNIQIGFDEADIKGGVKIAIPMGDDRFHSMVSSDWNENYTHSYSSPQKNKESSFKPYFEFKPPSGIYFQFLFNVVMDAGIGLIFGDQALISLKLESSQTLRVFFNIGINLNFSTIMDALERYFMIKVESGKNSLISHDPKDCCFTVDWLHDTFSIVFEMDFDIDILGMFELDFGKYSLTFRIKALDENPDFGQGCKRLLETSPNVCLNTDEKCYPDNAGVD